MNLASATKPLAEATSFLAGFTGKHTANMPILGTVLLTDSGNGEFHLAASDLETSARITIPLGVRKLEAQEESIAVPIEVLTTQIKAIAALSDTVQLRTTENRRLHLKTKRTSAHIVGSDGSEFPGMTWTLPDAEVMLLRRDWVFLLRSVMPASDTSTLDQNALTGVQVTAAGSEVRAVSTDQKRLNLATVHPAQGREDLFQVFLPRRFAQQTLRSLSLVGDEEPVYLGLNATLIVLWTRGVTLTSRQIGGRKFPDYSVLMRSDIEKKLLMKRSELLAALDAAMPFADRGVEIAPCIELAYADGALAVSCASPTVGEFRAEVEAQSYGCAPFKVGMNPLFVRDFVQACSCEEIAMIPPPHERAALQLRPGSGETESLIGFCMGMHP